MLQIATSAKPTNKPLKKRKKDFKFFLSFHLILVQRVLSRDMSMSLRGDKRLPFSLHIENHDNKAFK